MSELKSAEILVTTEPEIMTPDSLVFKQVLEQIKDLFAQKTSANPSSVIATKPSPSTKKTGKTTNATASMKDRLS